MSFSLRHDFKHDLLVNALGDLTEQEMGVDTARYMNCLFFFFPVCLFSISGGPNTCVSQHIGEDKYTH